ncbi:hypothetical protein GLOIN_2v1837680 [Rhizophagus clarus]|uniref:HECT domain-containing protein n=1 Tax=Rhizophagus clarus TaxID=94130 RepID=A0A8H3MEI3_9GLOM|nr:hypothetical protein GLOIN_2v1837680 [Rhizophagus clarus]
MLTGDLQNLDMLPRKCYKCNCQKFDRSNDNEEICAVCNDDEGEHHQWEVTISQTPLNQNFMMAQSSNVSNSNTAQIRTLANSNFNANTLSTQNIAGSANSDSRQTIQVPRNGFISGPYSSNGDDVNRFLNDEEVRSRLLNIRDNINIRETSQLYDKMRKKNKSFEPLVILLRYKGSKNMVPKEGTSIFKWLEEKQWIKNIKFTRSDANYVNKKILKNFPILKDYGWICLKPTQTNQLIPFREGQVIDGELLKSAATYRKRLYIAPKRSIILNDGKDNSDSESEQSSNGSDTADHSNESRGANSGSDNNRIIQRSNTQTSTATINLAQQLLDTEEFRTQILNKYRLDNHIYDNPISDIIIDTRNDIISSLLNWLHNANVLDILKKPVIKINDEDMTDTGGGFRDTTESFWEKIKTENVNGGRLFDDGENTFFIRYNNESTEWKYPEIIGKALFWCWLHQGTWPKWLHKMHLVYVIYGEENINTVNILGEYIPYLHDFVIDLQSDLRNNDKLSLWAITRNKNIEQLLTMSNHELSSYISKYEVVIKRLESLKLLKKGFNILNIIGLLQDYGWEKIERQLYKELNYDEFFNQFDSSINEFNMTTEARKRIFQWFQNYIFKQPKKNLELIMKFITGSSRTPVLMKIKIEWLGDAAGSTGSRLKRLPISSTCASVLILHDTYETDSISQINFEADLDTGFFESEGFDERLYRNNYTRLNSTISNAEVIDLTQTTTDLIEDDVDGSEGRRGGTSRRGNRRGRRGGRNHDTRGSTRGGNVVSRRGLRSQDQQQQNNTSLVNDNWNVLLPEHIEDQIRITRSGGRSQREVVYTHVLITC